MAMPAQIQEILNGPALKPPPGVIPNFVDPPNLKITSIVIATTFLALPTLMLCIKLYTNLYITRRGSTEDYTISLAWIAFVGFFVPSILATEYGGGKHQWDIQVKGVGKILLNIYVGTVMYGIIIFIIKLSILLQYLRIFVPTRRSNLVFWTSHVLIWTNLMFYSTWTLVMIFCCDPIHKYWTPLMTTGTCLNIPSLNTAASTVNVASNILMLILPQIVIWKLQMSPGRKLGISAIFLTGAFACVASVMRLYYAVKLSRTNDVTYYSTIIGMCSYPEIAFGIIVACLPSSPKFFHTLNRKKYGMPTLIRWLKLGSHLASTKTHTSSQAASAWNSGDARRFPKHYSPLTEPHELKKTASRYPASPDIPEEFLQGQILRTVSISAVTESVTDSRENSNLDAAGLWTKAWSKP